MNTNQENPRSELKAKLSYRRGAIKRICEKSGFSRIYVHLVMRGERKCELIWKTALEVLKEMEAEEESLNQEIKEALTSLNG